MILYTGRFICGLFYKIYVKVSWEDLCFPKDEGGLGVRKLRESARVFALKLIWRLFTQSSSLWVSWVRHYLLRYNSFWDVKDDSKGSWIWSKLLNFRDVAYQFLRIEVKNGRICRFWFDNWMGKSRLIDVTGAVGTTYLGVPRHAKVSNASAEESWRIRGERSRRYHELYDCIMAIKPPKPEKGEDIVMWKHGDDDFKAVFSAVRTWEQVR